LLCQVENGTWTGRGSLSKRCSGTKNVSDCSIDRGPAGGEHAVGSIAPKTLDSIARRHKEFRKSVARGHPAVERILNDVYGRRRRGERKGERREGGAEWIGGSDRP